MQRSRESSVESGSQGGRRPQAAQDTGREDTKESPRDSLDFLYMQNQVSKPPKYEEMGTIEQTDRDRNDENNLMLSHQWQSENQMTTNEIKPENPKFAYKNGPMTNSDQDTYRSIQTQQVPTIPSINNMVNNPGTNQQFQEPIILVLGNNGLQQLDQQRHPPPASQSAATMPPQQLQ